MAIFAVTGPLAIVLGFAFTSLIIQNGISWRWSFICQSILYGIFGIVLMFIPNVFFSKYQRIVTENNNDLKNNENLKGNEVQELDQDGHKKETKINNDNISLYEEVSVDDSELKNFWKNFCRILKIKVNKIFIIGVYANCILKCDFTIYINSNSILDN
jgi:hypothetical protein